MAHTSDPVSTPTYTGTDLEATTNPEAGPIHSRSREFWSGARDELPILLGAMPFGVIFGVLAMQSGQLNQAQAQAMSAVVFAGSAQFIAAQLLKDNATGIVIVLTVLVVNLRHMLYSASLAPLVKHLSAGWKVALAYLITDESYAIGISRYNRPDSLRPGNNAHWYFLGSGLTLWAAWQLSTAVGVFVGTQINNAIRSLLEFALPLTFIALVVPNLKSAGGIVAAVVSGIAIMLVHGLPFNSGLLAAAALGLASGFVADQLMGRRTR